MNALNHVYELKPFTSMWKVKVKIFRLWKQYSGPSYDGHNIEMVLVDSRGDKIHGTVQKDLVRQYERLLELGQTIILTNFNLAHESGVNRTTSHPFKIIFLPTTIVQKCDEQNENLARDRKKTLLKGKKFSRGANSPEGSLPSQPDETNVFSQAKRRKITSCNLEEAFNQSSSTTMACNVEVKKEKDDNSG